MIREICLENGIVQPKGIPTEIKILSRRKELYIHCRIWHVC
jgi:hypothetical protein